jgi:hypothetical protein
MESILMERGYGGMQGNDKLGVFDGHPMGAGQAGELRNHCIDRHTSRPLHYGLHLYRLARL